MSRNTCIAALVAAAATFCGYCETGAGTNVLARVDSEVLTTADLDTLVRLNLVLEEMRTRQTPDAAKIRAQLSRDLPKRFTERELLLKYARIAGYEPAVEERVQFMENVVRHNKAKSLGDLFARLPPDLVEPFKADLDKTLAATVAERMMREATHVTVAPEEVAAVLKRLEAGNESHGATNALIRARAKSVWESLERGETTFAQAASEFSEAEDEAPAAGEWGAFSLQDLAMLGSEQALIDCLPKMSAGDITEPIESDGGLAIVMLVGIRPATAEEGGAGSGGARPLYQLSRIFFRMLPTATIPSPEEIEESLRESKIDAACRKKLRAIADSSQVAQ